MTKDRIIIVLIVIISLASAGASFFKFYIERDYIVFANVTCDTSVHSCFVGDGEDTPEYYAMIEKKANTIPRCNGWLDECSELTCEENDETCSITYCEPGNGEECYGPTITTE